MMAGVYCTRYQADESCGLESVATMRYRRLMRRSGFLSILLALGACLPYGFAGGGLPSRIRTVAVIPFENLTSAPQLQQEITLALRAELKNKLGLRDAAEAHANAIVRGTIQRYETDIPVGFSGSNERQTSARRQLQISVDIEMIDQSNGKALWTRKGLLVDGQYEEHGEA